MGLQSACFHYIFQSFHQKRQMFFWSGRFVSLCHVLSCSCLPRSDHDSYAKLNLAPGIGLGGSAKQARDRRFQAILPLRGKILNVERKDDASLYKNNEISNLIVGLGLGLKGEDVTNLRYGKVSQYCSTCP